MNIITKPVSNTNYGGVVDQRRFIIIHANGATANSTAHWFANPDANVSYHYLITLNGDIWQFVDEGERAWHAGVSYWDGVSDLNDCSIGIAIESAENENSQLTDIQYSRLISLITEIQHRYNIPTKYVLGHKEVSPNRKTDPLHVNMDELRDDINGIKEKPPEYYDTLVLHGVRSFEIVNDTIVLRGKYIKTERGVKLDLRFL